MFRKPHHYLILTLFLAFSLGACEVDSPGDGGTSAIVGTLIVHDYDKEGNFKGIYPGYDEKVYLSYGDTEFIDDETRTGGNGKYRFNFLRNGVYKITAYSKCDTCVQDEVAVHQLITISEQRKEYDLGELIIIK